MAAMHLNDDELVLHYYGEMDAAEETRAAQHLSTCGACHQSYTKLQRVLAAVEAAPAPELPESFERTVWARLEPALGESRTGWLSWLVFSPARLAWIGAIVLLVAAAFVAGRVSREAPAAPQQAATTPAQVRERVLIGDLRDHLDRSQTMLVELASAPGAGAVDVSFDRARAEQLAFDNRLYRQSAAATGNVALASVLGELEPVLVELAAGPDELSADDLDRVQRRIENLLFKVRVVSSELRERQKSSIRMRTGQSS
jgi:hypothetical protein